MSQDLRDRIGEFKQQLQTRLAELKELDTMSKGSRATVKLDQTAVGRLSRMDAMQNQQIAAEMGRQRRLEIQRIQTALKRISNEEFGECLRCGEDIDVRRLEIDPATTLCIHCSGR